MAVKGVILDFGDTLVGYPLHTVSGQLEFIAKFAAEFFCRYPEIPQPKIPLEQFARELNVELSSGQTVALIERLSTERLLGSNLQLPQAEAFEREILNEVFKGARLLPDAKQFVQSARSAGYKLGIMSNLPWGSRHPCGAGLANLSLSSCFRRATCDYLVC